MAGALAMNKSVYMLPNDVKYLPLNPLFSPLQGIGIAATYQVDSNDARVTFSSEVKTGGLKDTLAKAKNDLYGRSRIIPSL